MPDPKLEEKGKSLKRGLQNTLALRMVAITVCFLVLPIVVLSVYLYFREYEQKRENNFFALDLIANEMKDVVSHFIDQNTTISETLAYAISLPSQQNRQLDTLFAQLTANEEVSDILYVKRERDQFFCTIASNKKYLGMNMTNVLSSIRFSEKKSQFFSYHFPNGDADTLISAYPIYAGTSFEGVILIFMSSGLFTSKIQFATNNHFPISTSILDSRGVVIASTREALLHTHFVVDRVRNPREGIELIPEKGSRENYSFPFQGEKRMAVYLPLQEAEYGVLIEISDTINVAPVGRFLMQMVFLLLLILVAGLVSTIWLTFRIVRPLNALCGIMLQVKEGRRQNRYREDRWGFEINLVGNIFNSMLDSFEKQVEEIRKERSEKEALAQELLLGQKIQRSLLPKTLPQVPSLQIASGFRSAKEVGGDYYDVLLREREGKKEVLLSIADASGKGVYACLFSLSVRSMIRSYFMKGYSLSEIIKDTNNLFHIDADDTSAFVTAWVAIFEVETGKVTYANCGHHAALQTTLDGKFIPLHTDNIALGVLPLESVQVAECTVRSGEGIFLFTDGVVEAHNQKGELFGEERLRQIMGKEHANPQLLVDTIFSSVDTFAEGAPQHDDITILSAVFEQAPLSDK